MCIASLKACRPYVDSREALEYAIATHKHSRRHGPALIHGVLKNSWKYQSLSIRQRPWLARGTAVEISAGNTLYRGRA